MFTKNDTFEQIMNTEPVKRAIGNLFPTCWLERIDAKHYSHTMRQIEAEVQMEWGVPFLSDAFVESANLLMETAVNHRFLFLPLWNPDMCPIASPDSADNCQTSSGNCIPDADRNCADTVWLFTGHPDHDATAFAHTAVQSSSPRRTNGQFHTSCCYYLSRRRIRNALYLFRRNSAGSAAGA